MNKRIRKKLHRKEFNWLGFTVTGQFDSSRTEEQRDLFMDLFIVALEANNLHCAGGWGLGAFDVEIGRSRRGRRLSAGRFRWHYGHCTQDDRDMVGTYLRNTGIDEYIIGPLKGSWSSNRQALRGVL